MTGQIKMAINNSFSYRMTMRPSIHNKITAHNTKYVPCFIVFILFFLISSFSFAEDFTANTIGNYGNITVMEVTGSLDANGDNASTAFPREKIAKEFYKTHSDDYEIIERGELNHD